MAIDTLIATINLLPNDEMEWVSHRTLQSLVTLPPPLSLFLPLLRNESLFIEICHNYILYLYAQYTRTIIPTKEMAGWLVSIISRLPHCVTLLWTLQI